MLLDRGSWAGQWILPASACLTAGAGAKGAEDGDGLDGVAGQVGLDIVGDGGEAEDLDVQLVAGGAGLRGPAG